ncbi:hypothetical protein LJC39_02505 [Parabacteroides sp. OttesenSCG-928-B22]|nr:hypothetical protein [Parabacteroides sp. OttesenSCG-928-B22]
MKVVYSKLAEKYLKDLIDILYEGNYFSFESAAVEYVDSLTIKMESTIHLLPKHKAPEYFSKYGKDLYYITCPKNKRTTWYFFFTYHPDSDIYYIRHITNNHVSAHLLG